MAKMIHIQVPSGVAPRQIDDFPADCERSVKGSLHVKPGTLLLTEGELEHLRKHHKDVARRLRIVGAVKEHLDTHPPEQPRVALAASAEPAPTPASTHKAPGAKGGRRGGSVDSHSDD